MHISCWELHEEISYLSAKYKDASISLAKQDQKLFGSMSVLCKIYCKALEVLE